MKLKAILNLSESENVSSEVKTISQEIEEFKKNEQKIQELKESIKKSLDEIKKYETANKSLFKRIESGMSAMKLKIVKASEWVAKLETVAKYKRITPNYKGLWEEALTKVTKNTRALLVSMQNTQKELKSQETKQQLTIEGGFSDYWRGLLSSLKNMFFSIKNFNKSVEELPEIE